MPGLPQGLAWSNEVSEVMLFLVTMCVAPWLLRQGQHIRVDILLQAIRSGQLVIEHACGECHGGGSNPASPVWLAGVTDTFQVFDVGPFRTRPRNLTPDNFARIAALRGEYETGPFTFGAQAKYVGERWTNLVNDEATPSYTVVDLDGRMDLDFINEPANVVFVGGLMEYPTYAGIQSADGFIAALDAVLAGRNAFERRRVRLGWP